MMRLKWPWQSSVIDKLDAPITTREFLAWGTMERKARRKSIVLVCVVLAILLAIISTSVIIDTSTSQHSIELETANQKYFAEQRARRAEAFSANEVKVCQALRDTIINQRAVLGILAYDQANIVFHNSAIATERRKTVKLVLDRINRTGLTSCDGFPAAPVLMPSSGPRG